MADPRRQVAEPDGEGALDEASYRTIFEHTPEAILVCRLEADRIGRFVAANAAAATLIGYTLEETLLLSGVELSPYAFEAPAPAWLGQLLAEGAAHGEGVIVRKDGRIVPVELRARLVHLGGERLGLLLVRDLSEHRRLEGERRDARVALRASEERYRRIFENAGAAMIVHRVDRARAGEIITANPAATALLGVSLADLIGKSARFLAAPEVAEQVRWGKDLFEHGFIEDESVVVREDGARFPVEFRTELSELDGERVAISFFRDASAQQRLERALGEAREAAAAAERAKTAFLANMSHEIRTPMNAILGYAQLFQRDPTLSAEQRGYLGIVKRSADQLLGMLDDILEMSTIEAGVRRLHEIPIDLPALATDVARMFQLRAEEKRLGFAVQFAPGLPRQIVADEGKVRRVLTKLLGNAFRFTDSGSVTLRMRVAFPPDARPRLGVEVEDTGPGLSADEIARLFRPFEKVRADEQALGGAGLGLALSRELCRLMGGEVGVRSELGRGSVFCFSVPVAVPLVAPAGDETTAGSRPSPGGATHQGAVFTSRAPPPSTELPRLPPELAAPLLEAARAGDLDLLRARIEALPPEHAATAAEIARLADEFAYDRIEAILG